ncbi:flagellar basal body P-ring protein FlgI [Burkholderia pseudomallei]|uniref:flagellar basal body P-ring protein FlgI n=1 Tax=Burkholderia pseudomallei TaxID=28450 RepID=UPI0004F72D5D|nr:flagellar basal body P-ring protein FlgI [Burkholderia pseudomallei]AIP67548.1 flagellar P-ring family protein [Burkholderia pseudomallei]AJW87972.1 flagellar P-ring family protein [Burkholderia pseudomallei 406e]CAJ2902935.1 flagellar basal body P-ring protein [Burkholderia pseudomallei]CAJ2938668.1 flagellar basal body P-ring protein [Burkholderia pseudomallei]CAJ2947343.1 flagellar basal body P-ring protein [Burkholderia pseudomallei]
MKLRFRDHYSRRHTRAQRVCAFAAILSLLSVLLMAASRSSDAAPLGTLVSVEGVRDNQLVGYGLVVGLNGSGDGQQIRYTGQSIANVLKQFGVTLPEGIRLRSRNVAAVMVSANFPAGYVPGQKIDVTVSSMGDAKSLRGGTLLLTPLRAADGVVYALAQGNLVVPGVSAQGRSGSSVTINATAAGRIPQGATIEQEIPSDIDAKPFVRLSLKRPSFQTATSIVAAIDRMAGPGAATSRDGTSVEVRAPEDPTARVAFLAKLTAINVTPQKEPPRVVFNSRTGTVVISQGMTVSPAAVSHGTLKVTISEGAIVSQPNPLGGGKTAVVPLSQVDVQQDGNRMFNWPAGVSLQKIVDTINSTGASPDDVMAILQALDEAGALNGELVVI